MIKKKCLGELVISGLQRNGKIEPMILQTDIPWQLGALLPDLAHTQQSHPKYTAFPDGYIMPISAYLVNN